jgi:MFS family permease
MARHLVWLVGLSHAANHYLMLIFPTVLLLVQSEYHLGYAALGLLANLGLFGYGLGALPAGILADRWGGSRLLAVWLLGGSLACAVIALSVGPVSLAIGFGLLGLFGSLHHPAGSGILVQLRTVPGLEMGRAFGLSGLLGNVGLAAAPLVSGVVAARWGWRSAFWVGVPLGLALGLSLWRLSPPAAPAPPADAPGDRRALSLRRALTLPLVILFGYETLMGFVFQGFSTFFPTHLAQHGEIPGLTLAQVTRGGSLASLAFLFGGFGHLLAGRLMGSRHRAVLFGGVMAITTLCLLGMAQLRGPGLVVASIGMTFTFFALGTISNTLIAVHTPPHLAGTAFGITFTLAFSVGSLAASTMGILAEQAGLPQVFTGLGAVAVGAFCLVLWFARITGTSGDRAAPASPHPPPSR